MRSRCAFPRIEVSLRPSLSPITRVGVLSRASCRSLRTSLALQFLFLLRVYFGLALRGPLRPIGEPRHSQLKRPRAVFAIVSLPALKMPRDNAWRGTNVPRHAFCLGVSAVKRPLRCALLFQTKSRTHHTATDASRGIRRDIPTIRECKCARRIARTRSRGASARILRYRETLPLGYLPATRDPVPLRF
jgi:hypothetical protein